MNRRSFILSTAVGAVLAVVGVSGSGAGVDGDVGVEGAGISLGVAPVNPARTYEIAAAAV